MIRSLLFFMIVLGLDTASAAYQCADIFTVSAQTPLIARFPHATMKAEKNSWDVSEHGIVVRGASDKQASGALRSLIAERDGTYPLIIDQKFNLVMDHRLPSTRASLDGEYVGNHRGLYQRLKEELGQTPQIVFAGQVRVINGQVISLIDQSGTFYFTPKDLGFHGANRLELLIAENQARLLQAKEYLDELGITTSHTKLINFVEHFRNYPPESRNDGHAKAQDVARFELQCRANPTCWGIVNAINLRLRRMNTAGRSNTEVMEDLRAVIKGNIFETFEFLQFWNMILAEGTLDVLSARGMMDPTTQSGAILKDFMIQLEQRMPLDE